MRSTIPELAAGKLES